MMNSSSIPGGANVPLQDMNNVPLEWESSAASAIASLPPEALGTISSGLINAATTAATSSPATGTAAGTTAASSSSSSFFSLPSSSSLFGKTIMNAGLNYGEKLMDKTGLNAGFVGWLRNSSLRYYFTVNNSYVTSKLLRVLVPFKNWAPTHWVRVQASAVESDPLLNMELGQMDLPNSNSNTAQMQQNPASVGRNSTHKFAHPKDDVNAPDLYIPMMAFATLIVLMGFALGTADKFNPDILSATASRALVCLVLEVLCLFSAFYLIELPHTPTTLELISLSGYKFVTLIVDVLVGILFGRVAFWCTFFVLSFSLTIFMVRTLQGWQTGALGDNVEGGIESSVPHEQPKMGKKFHTLIMIICGLQVLFSIILLWPILSTFTSNGILMHILTSISSLTASASGGGNTGNIDSSNTSTGSHVVVSPGDDTAQLEQIHDVIGKVVDGSASTATSSSTDSATKGQVTHIGEEVPTSPPTTDTTKTSDAVETPATKPTPSTPSQSDSDAPIQIPTTTPSSTDDDGVRSIEGTPASPDGEVVVPTTPTPSVKPTQPAAVTPTGPATGKIDSSKPALRNRRRNGDKSGASSAKNSPAKAPKVPSLKIGNRKKPSKP